MSVESVGVMQREKREFVARNLRIQSRPGQFSNYVRFATEGRGVQISSGQFGDVSASGMRLISRFPIRTKVGEILKVEFTLPGSDRNFVERARVVRKQNDHIFAVQFIESEHGNPRLLHESIARSFVHLRKASTTAPLRRFSIWLRAHGQGLLISLTAIVIGIGAASWIYLNSDEHLGRRLRSWGAPVPKQMYWDYYNKIPKQ